MQTTSDISLINQTISAAAGAHILPPPPSSDATRTCYELKLKFNDNAVSAASAPANRQLKDLINEKILNKQLFYGIEISARNYYPKTTLNYQSFGPILPLFTSIVWLSSEYWNFENIEEIESVQLAHKLQPHTVVLPHFSCYRLQHQRLEEFLNLNFSNILTIRGDQYDPDQEYKHSSEIVADIRKIRGDSITIGVAGYPEGHPECASIEEDLDNLMKKVSVGADFIITQICFSTQSIIDFIKSCRSRNIRIPILVGIFVPDNLRGLETILRITKIKIPAEDLSAYRNHSSMGRSNFSEYAINKASQMIQTIFDSDVGIYGVQFFTMNKFKNVPKVLQKINENTNLIK